MDANQRILIEEHMALVDHIVRRVAGNFPSHVDRSELAAAGRLGLTEAALRYQPSSGVPFTAFAARRIRGSVLDAMRATDWVPRSVRDVGRRADEASVKLQNGTDGTPDDDAIALRMGIDVARLREARSAIAHGNIGTLDRSNVDGTSSIGELLSDPTVSSTAEILENRELHGYLRSALASLPERLRVIIVGHYLEGRPLEELADLLGLTASRVSQLRSDAVEILRDGIESQFTSLSADRPKGRVEIRRAQFAASVARHSDWRARLALSRFEAQRADDNPPHNEVAQRV